MAHVLRNLAIVSTVLLGACATEREYVSRTTVTSATAPATGTTIEYAGQLATLRGKVRAASYGAVRIVSKVPSEKQQLRALHLRLVLTNNGDKNWVLDVRDQRLDLGSYGRSTPAFAATRPGTSLPEVAIPPSHEGVVDLFFPLPSNLQDAPELPRFGALWWLNVEDEVIVERTPFERLYAEPTEYSAYDYGVDHWAPPYWHNPIYTEFAFVGAPEIDTYLITRPIDVRRESSVRFAPAPAASQDQP